MHNVNLFECLWLKSQLTIPLNIYNSFPFVIMQLKGLDLKLISEADDKSKDDYRPGNPFITFRSEV